MYRVLCLLCNPSSLATPTSLSLSPLNLVVAQLCYEMFLLVSYGKTTKFNELPGWNWYCSGYVEWLHRSHVYGGRVYRTCGRPPRNKEILDNLAH